MITCPSCNGNKIIGGFGCPGFRPINIECDICLGKGTISEKQMLKIKQGRKIREERLSRGMTLRAEAKRLNVDAYELSQIEQGIK